MNIYIRILSYMRPYWKAFIFAFVCMVVVSATTGLTAWIVQPVLDDIFIKKDVFMLKLLPFAVVVLYLGRGIFRYLASYTMNSIGIVVVMKIRNDLYNHLQTLSLNFFHGKRTGELMSRITSDVSLIEGSASNLLSDFVREILSMAGLIFVIFYRDWELAIIALLVFPPSLYFLVKIGEKLKRLSRKSQEKMADMASVLQENFTGIRVIKAFNKEEYESRRFSEENSRFFNLAKKTVKYVEISSPLMEFVGAFGLAMIVWYGGMKVINDQISPGSFFSFMAALFMLYAPVRKLSRSNNKLQQAIAAALRVFYIIDTKPEIVDKDDAVALPSLSKRIEFRDVGFRYDTEPVLKDINLKINKGEIIAIVGVSGVGKTTLVDLIPRFYDVTGGSIKIDDIDIRNVALKSLRDQIGIVTQEIFLFNHTVRYNIAYGKQDASMEEIIQTAKAAYAHDFIMKMPDQYDTVIGERGVKLSGGQRQRIAIARALTKDPPILILDEATSSLDTESEQIVQKALQNLMKNRTTFVIAHRLSTIVRADRIVVLDEGTIIDIGSHEELLKRGGLYHKLHEMQFQYT
ncbi:MAG TPA: lipid A export permease/ATP-binding protein MsbA [Nitrospinota bacterium]|nr:lipid A export permease/ATP-binding protein MsbA [Nitrospinota bacterium]